VVATPALVVDEKVVATAVLTPSCISEPIESLTR
jgi:hypothetical protein